MNGVWVWGTGQSKTISKVFQALATEIIDKDVCQATEFEICSEKLCYSLA